LITRLVYLRVLAHVQHHYIITTSLRLSLEDAPEEYKSEGLG